MLGRVQVDVFCTCLVKACVGDVGNLVERSPWYIIHVRGSG
jgi:hypothetical protein